MTPGPACHVTDTGTLGLRWIRSKTSLHSLMGFGALINFASFQNNRRSPKQVTRKNDTSFGFLDRHFSKTGEVAQWVEALAGKPEAGVLFYTICSRFLIQSPCSLSKDLKSIKSSEVVTEL